MYECIKNKIKKLGFISIELVILASIVMTAGGIGISKLAQNATGVMNVFNDSYYDELEATKSELTVKIIGRNHVNYLYDVGEKNLTDEDIVQINGVDCYVLKVEDDRAMLITKDIYDVRFDTGDHTAEETIHLGTGSYANKTYDYYYSTLRTWMNKFYRTQLGADSRVLPTNVTYYTLDSYSTEDERDNLANYTTGTIANQYVFALDAKEAKQYVSKFSWNYANQMSGRSYGFWTTTGRRDGGNSVAWYVSSNGSFDIGHVVSFLIGARPAFWISLD